MSEPTPEPAKPSKDSKKPAAARKSKAHAAPAGAILLRWNLSELPSSQHKAGLAGLALSVEYLKRSHQLKGECAIDVLDGHGLALRVDREGMQSLFDSVYAAAAEEKEVDKKFQRKKSDGTKVDVEPKTTRERTVEDKKGVAKTKTVFVYDQTVPRGGLVDDWDDSPTKTWLKLWRDLVWTTLRGVPATREPYDARAEKREASDGAEEWDALASSPMGGVDLPSTYYLGAQAKSAENVSFRDVARYRFLLHFWPFVTPIYVPAVVGRDGDREFTGYAIVVPEVSDLAGFVAKWEQVARSRGGEVSGYRPRDAVIDVAAEAGLDVARRTFEILGAGHVNSNPWMRAVDVFHIEKEGNNVRLRGVARVDLQRNRANDYGRARKEYWSPHFRRQRIINILEQRDDWWAGFGRLCATTPQENTIQDSKFRHDCRVAFTEVEMTEATDDSPPTLEQLVYQTVRAYVYGRLESKYDLAWKTVQGKGDAKEKEYNDKKLKLAREAFLAIRSRTGADFVSYFTGTLCSVQHRLSESSFLLLAQALQGEAQIERVRSLTLLALSAA